MSEQTMTAGELLEAYDSYRTQHMQTLPVRGEYDPLIGDDIVRGPDARPVMHDVLVLDAEVQHEGAWRKVQQVGTDHNDESQPVFLDLEDAGRVVLAMGDTVSVRGLTEADPRVGPA